MHVLPEDVAPYSRSAEFTEATVPAGFLRDHATRAGVWGVINVLEGALRYRVAASGDEVVLNTGQSVVVAPGERHAVTPLGNVRFFVEFYR